GDDPEGQSRVAAFLQPLQELGWTDGHNVRIDTRWAAGDADRHRRYAAELVALAPDVILASGSPALMSLQQLTRTVPIVFVNIVDPVGAGFVESLARPGGNTTGFVLYEYGMSAKWLELLKEIVPPVEACGSPSGPGHSLRGRPVRCNPGRGAVIRGGVARRRSERRRRNRAGRHRIRALLEWRPDRDGEPPAAGSSRSGHHTCRPAPVA